MKVFGGQVIGGVEDELLLSMQTRTHWSDVPQEQRQIILRAARVLDLEKDPSAERHGLTFVHDSVLARLGA